jgi:hypothetical protein
LDRKSFKTDKLFRQALQQTLQNFGSKLKGAKPTVIFTGGGYHLLQSLDADIVLEEQPIFKEFISFEPSRKLMQYAEMKLTNNMCDPVHNHTVAFNNCLIRVPNSYNSKYVRRDGDIDLVRSKVRIVQLGNGSVYKPNIRYLIEGLWEHLIQLRNNEISNRLAAEQRRIKFEIEHPYDVTPPGVKRYQISRIDWIERLMEKALEDGRKYCITFILVPYFINLKRLSDLDTLDRIKVWLEKCKSIHRLDFNVSRVKDDIKSVRRLQRNRHFIKPKALHKIKMENPELYTLLQKQAIVY